MHRQQRISASTGALANANHVSVAQTTGVPRSSAELKRASTAGSHRHYTTTSTSRTSFRKKPHKVPARGITFQQRASIDPAHELAVIKHVLTREMHIQRLYCLTQQCMTKLPS